MDKRHVLLVTFPAQGHINPSLQFAKTLIHMGIHVTFATSVYALRRMAAVNKKGLTFTSFSDGYDDGFKPATDDARKYMVEIKSQGSKTLRDAIAAAAEGGCPVTRVVYTLLLPWAAEVAREFHLPSALLWIQPATVLSLYYYYFHGYAEEISSCSESDDATWKIQIPGIKTSFSKRDLPSFMLPSTSDIYSFALPSFKEQLDTLDAETKPRVLVNTFDSLECDALKSIGEYELIGVGPLIPSAFLDGEDPTDDSVGGDLFKKSVDYLEWLNEKPRGSVVYVSFGSLLTLPKRQMEEIGKGLLEAKRPFLWVIRADVDEKMSCLEELERVGKIVPWCSQLEVLTHASLGCFVTHCGWNSTLESLSCGVPVVAFPSWTDQGTNAKLIEDVWRTGVRVSVNEELGVVESREIRRCIEEVMSQGDDGELRKNAHKWKDLAREAVGDNGSSNINLNAFFN